MSLAAALMTALGRFLVVIGIGLLWSIRRKHETQSDSLTRSDL